MASRPWSDAELELLSSAIQRGEKISAVASKISGRTKLAIKVRMSKLRDKYDLSDARRSDIDDMDEFNARAVIASQMLLAATLRVGVWS